MRDLSTYRRNDDEDPPGAPMKPAREFEISKELEEFFKSQSLPLDNLFDLSNLKPGQQRDMDRGLSVVKLPVFITHAASGKRRNEDMLVVSPPEVHLGRPGHWVYDPVAEGRKRFESVSEEDVAIVYVDKGYSIKKIHPQHPRHSTQRVHPIAHPYLRDANGILWDVVKGDVYSSPPTDSGERAPDPAVVSIHELQENPKGGDLYVSHGGITYQVRQEKVGNVLPVAELNRPYTQPIHEYAEWDDATIRSLSDVTEHANIVSNDKGVNKRSRIEPEQRRVSRFTRMRLYHFDHAGEVSLVAEKRIVAKASRSKKLFRM